MSSLAFLAADPLLLPLQERSSPELLSFETGEVIDGFVASPFLLFLLFLS